MVVIEGYSYKQNANSPLTFTFVRGVSDVTNWCGVPRKSSSGQMGYQRHLEPARQEKISRFFGGAENSSPTSIVLGFYPDSTKVEIYDEELQEWIEHVEEQHEVNNTQSVENMVNMLNGEGAEIGIDEGVGDQIIDYRQKIRRTRITFDDPGNKTVKEIATALLHRLRVRLPDEEPELPTGDEESDLDSEEDDESDEESNEDNIEFGKTQLTDLIQGLQNDEFIAANEETIRDLGMPALVIDGQHRLFGAEAIGNIPFTFVSILNADWKEQVFQFCVINKCAKAVDDDVITSNAALSLTGTELSLVESRLTVAGFNIEKVDIMNRCFLDEGAPFHGMVKMPGYTDEENRPLLGSKQVVKLAKNPWRNGKGPFLKEMKKQLYGTEITASERNLVWKESGDWAKAFNLFWDIFSEEYAVYISTGNEPMKTAGQQHWGLPQGESNLSKTGCLQAITTSFSQVLNSQFNLNKQQQINEFQHPVYVDEDAWDTLKRKIKQNICDKLALKRMLENHWTITQLNTSDNQRIMIPYLTKHMTNSESGANWTQSPNFRQDGAL